MLPRLIISRTRADFFFILRNDVSMCAYASGNEYFHIGMPIIDPPVRYCHNYISLSSFSHVIQYTILHSYAALSVDSAS